jgi:glutamine amidotransferase
VVKRPAAAWADEAFAREAREERSTTFLAHVRYASEGAVRLENSHPFEQDGRVLAHNGHIGGMELLEAELGEAMALVKGDTDSERFFALVTREIGRRGCDPGEALVAAAGWCAENLPLFALNCLLVSATDVWALRYPETHELLMLERRPDGRTLDAAGTSGRIRVRSGDLAERPAVAFATEPMDDDPGWHGLAPGELVHVDGDLRVTRSIALDRPPAHQLRLSDLAPHAAVAQGVTLR